MKAFDLKFGADFVAQLPSSPGVYRVFDASGTLVYVGKAKRLRRRLAQYRNAKRIRAHAKMREIVKHGVKIEYELCQSDLEASLLELKLIQSLRPRLNVAGAYSFLYPFIGLEEKQGRVTLIYTSRPELFEKARWHGSFRSRSTTKEGFEALRGLLKFVFNNRPHKLPRHHFSIAHSFERFDESWSHSLELFLRGESKDFLEKLLMALIEKDQARLRPNAVQEHLKELKRFWRFEARPLRKMILTTGFEAYPVPQSERDLLKTTSRFNLVKSSHS